MHLYESIGMLILAALMIGCRSSNDTYLPESQDNIPQVRAVEYDYQKAPHRLDPHIDLMITGLADEDFATLQVEDASGMTEVGGSVRNGLASGLPLAEFDSRYYIALSAEGYSVSPSGYTIEVLGGVIHVVNDGVSTIYSEPLLFEFTLN